MHNTMILLVNYYSFIHSFVHLLVYLFMYNTSLDGLIADIIVLSVIWELILCIALFVCVTANFAIQIPGRMPKIPGHLLL